MRTINKGIFLFSMLVTSTGAFAQTTPTLNSQQDLINRQRNFDQNNFQGQKTLVSMVNDYDYNYKYDFVVTLKDGTKKTAKSKIYSDEHSLKTYVMFEDKKLAKTDPNRIQKIYSSQTLGIERELGNLDIGDGNIKGIPTDSCWMFKAMSGPVNAYSFLSIQDDGQTFNPATIVGIQKDNGTIVPLTNDNLVSMISSDNNAMAFIEKKDYYNAIKTYNADNGKK